MTFCEAFALFGRDTDAIAQHTGLSEAEAYNLMAARVDRDLGIFPDQERRERQREASRRWREMNKALNAELRREACA